MPAITSNSLVLVTGASGFVGTHTVVTLAAKGFRVRAAVRSDDKGEYLKKLVGEALEYVVVPDQVEPGAYDLAAKGVAGIIHLATPIPKGELAMKDPEEFFIKATITGLHNILASAVAAGSVKRFILVSSVATVGPGTGGFAQLDLSVTLDEKSWYTDVVDTVRKLGAAANPMQKYAASKVEQEKAFWAYFDQPAAFDGVSILPSMNFGPPIQYELGSTVQFMFPWLEPGQSDDKLSNSYDNFIDVRDVALSCVLALTTAEAGGERFISSADTLFGNDFALAAASFPKLVAAGINTGNADPAFRAALEVKSPVYDGSKLARVLGITYRRKEDTLKETIAFVLASREKNEVL